MEETGRVFSRKEVYQLLFERFVCSANKEMEDIQKTYEADIAVLKGQLRKTEMTSKNLEKQLEQKVCWLSLGCYCLVLPGAGTPSNAFE